MGKSILVVEDYPETLGLFKAVLEGEGYTVKAVETGEQTLEVLSVNSYDLVILDIMLPRIDGFEVCKRIKADPKTKNVPVVAVTAFDVPDILKRCNAVGVDEVVIKPFDPNNLVSVIKKYVP